MFSARLSTYRFRILYGGGGGYVTLSEWLCGSVNLIVSGRPASKI